MKGCGVAVPTKEEFDAWLALATTPIEVGASLPPEPTEVSVDDAANYLRQSDIDLRQRLRVMDASAAWKWLAGQSYYQRAEDRVFNIRGERKCSDAELELVSQIEAENERAIYHGRAHNYYYLAVTKTQRASEGGVTANEYHRAREFRRLIERAGSRAFDDSWQVKTMRAVAEYLEGKAATRFLNAAAEIDDAARAARESVARYVRLAEEINGANFQSVRVRGLRSPTLRVEFDVPDLAASPISRRRDTRGDERLFVYRMFVANRSEVRSAKPEAIADLMCLEGFRHQYETRTIERLCKRFAELHKRPSPRLSAVGMPE